MNLIARLFGVLWSILGSIARFVRKYYPIILGLLLIAAAGISFSLLLKLVPAKISLGGLAAGSIGILLELILVTGFIFGLANLSSDRERAMRLFNYSMRGFEGLLTIAAIVGTMFTVKYVFMNLYFMNQKPVTTVSDEPARQEIWQPELTSVGNLTPVQGADISNQVAGNVVAVNFDSGQRVNKGQLLVQLDDSNERAELQGYQAQEKLAALNASRAHELYSKHLVSKSDLDTADSNLQQAQANVANTQANIAKKAIHAPFSGHAGIRNVNIGQYLPQGTVIVTLQALDHMYASFTLPEQALPNIESGQKVMVTVDAYPKQKFSGEVNAIDSKVDPSTHNVRVQALIANPGRELRAGMFANISVSAGGKQQVVTVPKAAVTYSLYGDSVFVVSTDKNDKNADGDPALKATEVFIKLGAERGSRVEVTDGVKPGDLIVTSGMQKLHSGALVRIDNSVTPDPLGEADK